MHERKKNDGIIVLKKDQHTSSLTRLQKRQYLI